MLSTRGPWELASVEGGIENGWLKAQRVNDIDEILVGQLPMFTKRASDAVPEMRNARPS